MTTPTILQVAERVLALDKEAAPGPWTRWFVVVPNQTNPNEEKVDLVHGAAPPHECTSNHDGAINKAGIDGNLISEFRTACPQLARALILAEKKMGVAMEALNAFGTPMCENFHHNKPNRHEYGEPCPIEIRIQEALAKIEEMEKAKESK